MEKNVDLHSPPEEDKRSDSESDSNSDEDTEQQKNKQPQQPQQDAAAARSAASIIAAYRRRGQRRIRRQSSCEPSSPLHTLSGPRLWKNSRRTREGYRKAFDKKGGSGRGNWGTLGSELLETFDEQNDPNYDNEDMSHGNIELIEVIPTVKPEQLRNEIATVLYEYFENIDINEALSMFSIVVPKTHRSQLVRICIELAMERKNSQREMTSQLISEFYNEVAREVDIEQGFESVLSDIDDLILDNPEAPTIIGNFVARAIADDCIPPRFIEDMRRKFRNTNVVHAMEAVDKAGTLISMQHGMVRLHNVWGMGGGWKPVKYLTRQINVILKEYLASRDTDEAIRCITELEVPHFHHELVYEAIVMAFETQNVSDTQALIKLLIALSNACIVSPEEMKKGFKRIIGDIKDIQKDIPMAFEKLHSFAEACLAAGVLPLELYEKLPSRGRKRFVSESDSKFRYRNQRLSPEKNVEDVKA